MNFAVLRHIAITSSNFVSVMKIIPLFVLYVALISVVMAMCLVGNDGAHPYENSS